jgi:hypothetical protein
MRFALPLFAIALFAGSIPAADVDVGLVDQKAPKKTDLAPPPKDAKPTTVDLTATLTGKVTKGEKRHVYFVICPLGKKGDAGADWWVQGEVTKDGEAVSCDAQFGEADAGSGEWFAVAAVATDKKWGVGEQLSSLPADAAFSKVVVVKRK